MPLQAYAVYTRFIWCGIYDKDPDWCALCAKRKDSAGVAALLGDSAASDGVGSRALTPDSVPLSL